MTRPGICYLVGAGPGDPDLITVRGLKCLRRADVVYYDRLVSPEIVEEAPAQARLVYVGKASGRHCVPQERISALLCGDVRQGLTVVRLKGGDPFVFGRGGEEALALARAGLPFEVVPGVTAGIAAPAYAGIPVTHRRVARAVTFVTGHEASDPEGAQTDWDGLARAAHTLCIYMGTKALPDIRDRLLEAGRSPEEPAAVIEWGTLPRQRCVVGVLADIAEKAAAANMRPPSLVVVGEVVALREQLDWFRPEPARPDGDAGALWQPAAVAAQGSGAPAEGEPLPSPTTP
ncbi:MAG: hypothetical protein Kow0092_18800 [Deferrisomatales bacterium]